MSGTLSVAAPASEADVSRDVSTDRFWPVAGASVIAVGMPEKKAGETPAFFSRIDAA